jgi:ketosteroid isomerase-like protein
MLRSLALPILVLALAPALAAQPDADRALVAQLYDDLSRGDLSAVVAVLDDHVLWIEGAHSPQAGRHLGPGTVAALVLHPRAAARTAADVPDAITVDAGRVVAVGTTRRIDPATGQLVVARFRHVWQVLDGRVVTVHRSDDGPDLMASDLCGPEPC